MQGKHLSDASGAISGGPVQAWPFYKVIWLLPADPHR